MVIVKYSLSLEGETTQWRGRGEGAKPRRPSQPPSPVTAKYKLTLLLSSADLSLNGEVKRNLCRNSKHKSGLVRPPHPLFLSSLPFAKQQRPLPHGEAERNSCINSNIRVCCDYKLRKSPHRGGDRWYLVSAANLVPTSEGDYLRKLKISCIEHNCKIITSNLPHPVALNSHSSLSANDLSPGAR